MGKRCDAPGEKEDDKKNEVGETTGASTRNLLALATNQLNDKIMKKNFRMFVGIILHPVRVIIANLRRAKYEEQIRDNVKDNWWKKNHSRMHDMSWLTDTAYTESDLYRNLYANAL